MLWGGMYKMGRLQARIMGVREERCAHVLPRVTSSGNATALRVQVGQEAANARAGACGDGPQEQERDDDRRGTACVDERHKDQAKHRRRDEAGGLPRPLRLGVRSVAPEPGLDQVGQVDNDDRHDTDREGHVGVVVAKGPANEHEGHKGGGRHHDPDRYVVVLLALEASDAAVEHVHGGQGQDKEQASADANTAGPDIGERNRSKEEEQPATKEALGDDGRLEDALVLGIAERLEHPQCDDGRARSNTGPRDDRQVAQIEAVEEERG
eukprot:Mycagemm_TRINITY_DN10208_c0_g1::TRINITY_DN10208_c0_g1_i1::g.4074::m.4074 type:complete len:267 gc:universal TRINITY_DN10208_c0_g1_i1:1549-749(-)